MSLVTLWRDYKRPLPDIPFPLVINLLKGQAVILWIAVLMTLIGWGRLSILVCVAYAAVAVCVQQAVGFMRLMNVIAEHMPQEGGEGFVQRVPAGSGASRHARAGDGGNGALDSGLSRRASSC